MESELENGEKHLKADLELIQCLFLPEFTEASNRSLTEEDFSVYKTLCETKLPVLRENIVSFEGEYHLYLNENAHNKNKVDFISSLIILCSQHSGKYLWTTESSQCLAKSLMEYLLKFSNFSKLSSLLTHNKEDIFKHILRHLRPWLLPETWKHFPGGVIAYSWILQHVELPHLSEHLSIVLPSALIITDDFEIENRIIGIQCLEHIITNVTNSELSWYGQDNVIFEAIQPSLYRKDVELVPPLYSLLIALLEKMYSQTLHPNLEWTKYDDILIIILGNMYLEQRIAIRGVYIKMLPDYIKSMGLTVTRHLPKMMDVLEEYILEPTTTLATLKVLDELLFVGWPRMSRYGRRLVIILLKALRDATCETRHSDEAPKALKTALSTLVKLCPVTAQELISGRSRLNINPKFEEALSQVLTEAI